MGNTSSNSARLSTRVHTQNRRAAGRRAPPPPSPPMPPMPTRTAATPNANATAPPPAPANGAGGAPRATNNRRGNGGARANPRDMIITGELRDINEFYEVDKKELGHGHYGTVRVGVSKRLGIKVAIKTIPKSKVSRPETMQREISILQQVNHPNIIKLYDVFESQRHLHLVTELCTGGELFDRIIARGHYSEADAAVLVRKICSAVAHCHEREICHRDLKPENFLFQTPAEDAELKVIDFGLSRMYDAPNAAPMTTRVGTPYYIAPEVLGRHYDKSCDLWSIGVITYILLCGYPPFYGDSDPEIFASVRAGRYDFATPEWANVSNEAKDLISHLLLLDPAKRLTAEQVLQHRWLTGMAPDMAPALSTNLFSRLKHFTQQNKFKKVVLGVIADLMTESEIAELRNQFMAIDTDGNGVITISELADAMRGMGHTMVEEEVMELMKGIDIDGDGKVDYSEFLAATMRRNLANKEEYLINAFRYFDTKQQGVITKDDLVQFMGNEVQAQEVIDEVDANGDGVISFEEFVAMMRRKGFGEEGDIHMDSGNDGNGIDSFLSAQYVPSQAPSHPVYKETEL